MTAKTCAFAQVFELFEIMEDTLGKLHMTTCGEQFRLSTDSMVLADFVRPGKNWKIADLGCGCGALSLLLCDREPSCFLTGVELQPEAAEAARKNAQSNALSGRFTVVEGDLRQHRSLLPAGCFDAVVSNPPYYPVGSGAPNDSFCLTLARTELCCTPEDLCRCAAYLLRFSGSFFLVHKPERLCDLFCCLRENRLEPKTLRFVRRDANSAISLFLLHARLGGKSGLNILPDLLLFHPDGTPTEDHRRIYHL